MYFKGSLLGGDMKIKLSFYLFIFAFLCIFTGCVSVFNEHGNEIIFNVLPSSPEVSEKDIDWNKLAEAMNKRLDTIYPNIKHEVSRTEDDHLSVKVSKIPEKDSETFADIIKRQGVIQFRLVHEDSTKLVDSMLKDPDKFKVPDGYEKMSPLDKKNGRISYFVKVIPEMDGGNIINASSSIDQFGQRYIHVSFNSEGASKFAGITGKNVNRQLAIVIDGKLYSAPIIRTAINGGQAMITGIFTKEESKEIAACLVAGALSSKLEIKEIKGDKSNCIPEDKRSDSELLQEDARKGNSEAQYTLGFMYYSGGMGFSQDYSKAVEWFGKAAGQEHPLAQYAIGTMFYEGKGVTRDYVKSVEWFRKAAEQGNAKASGNLGYIYQSGFEGVPINYKEAGKWYLKAIDNGYKDVKNELAYLWAEQGINLDKAKKLAEEAVQEKPGESACLDTLGWVLYKQGHYTEAIKQFEKASEISPKDAAVMDHLACAYLKLGEKDKAKVEWSKALELNPDGKLKSQIKTNLEALGKY
ncbi:MAG TPA: hypothetical protein DCZ94_15850 [Lentisphaeria bacterium]|nr:MAG: hypothetical protein A2X48_18585 [Lentisphaerae bacterium GWF2_49_21]HBC88422.1 hypothetical protein [Lentisphaeria bacterium]